MLSPITINKSKQISQPDTKSVHVRTKQYSITKAGVNLPQTAPPLFSPPAIHPMQHCLARQMDKAQHPRSQISPTPIPQMWYYLNSDTPHFNNQEHCTVAINLQLKINIMKANPHHTVVLK